MGLAVENRRIDGIDFSCPVAICDVCGEIIRDGDHANYLWIWKKPYQVTTALLIAHKTPCTLKIDQSTQEAFVGAEELHHLPRCLAANLKQEI